MDPERKRIEEDLRGLLAGDVQCDDLTTQLYATDASIYELRPVGVVRPRTTSDVIALAKYATSQQLALHPRGAGSGLAGESLGHGLVVDFSRHMRRVLVARGEQVRVQSGVVHAELNRMLEPQGRVFGPDPANSNVTTLGSMINIDAAGSRWLRYGSVRSHVREVRVVLADGTELTLGQHPVDDALAPDDPPALRQLVARVAELVQRNAGVIASGQPKSVVNRSGYALDQVFTGGTVDLAKLIVGSEGTLAMVVEAELDTQTLPQHVGCALLVFDSLEKAAHAVHEVLTLGPSACDLMDRRHLSLARESDTRYELLIPGAAEAVLLVEHSGDLAEEVHQRLRRTVQLVTVEARLAAAAQVATERDDIDLFWSLARRFVPTLYRLRGNRRAVPCVEDIAVPVNALPVFLRHLQDVLKQEQITASVFGHVGHGQLHIRPLLDLSSPDDVRRMETLAGELYERVWLLGGTISGQHGDGLSRTPYLSRQYGPLVNVFRDLKRVFDPQGILNPGKVVPHAGRRMTHDLRRIVPAEPVPSESSNGSPPAVQLALGWTASEVALATRACNGCGACRTRLAPERMCPVGRISPSEEASPRAKANLLRAVITGQLPPDTLLQPEAKQVADLCFHCHMCRVECPASADIPRMVFEAKASYVQTNGLTMHDWFFSRIDQVSRYASRVPGVANWLLRNRQARWLLEKFFGVAQGRNLPRLARRSFLKLAERYRLHEPGDDAAHKVVYFVDTYANYYDPRLGEALVAILRHNGVAVHVPPSQASSAMPLVAHGVADQARLIAKRNVALLAESVRRGYAVVATEPSAVLALRHEYPALLEDEGEDARLVADNAYDASQYLWKLHGHGVLQLNFRSVEREVAYHVPCHIKALEIGTPTENLLRLVPGLRVTRVEKGCSGMAGTYGLKQRNYRSSLRMGLPLIGEIRDSRYEVATTECSTCKLQLDQGTGKPTMHPLYLLAEAYGLRPHLRAPGK